MRRSLLPILALLAIVTLAISACTSPAGGQVASGRAAEGMAPVSALPRAMQEAPPRVRSAYQFAVANPAALQDVPCYCGCGAMGHTSNLACFMKDRNADGPIEFDEHALGCSVCVDIAQDVMRMTGEGKSTQDIRAVIVSTYSKFGPGNQ